MAKRMQQKPRKQRSLRGLVRHGLALLMAMIMVISLIQISAFAEGNDTEFHIMTLEDIENAVAQRTEFSADSVIIRRVEVHGMAVVGSEATATGGSINYGAGYNGTAYWKVLNTCDILDTERKITGLTIYFCAEDQFLNCYVDGSDLNVVHLGGLSSHITEIYFKDSGDQEPQPQTYPVYVYVEPKDGQGTINDHQYLTVGQISMPVSDPAQADVEQNYYQDYTQQVETALASIQRFEANDWLDLADVEWTTLHVCYGADDYVSDSSQLVWHLDGKIKDEVELFSVYYDANGGQGDVPVDTNQYAAGQPFSAMSGAGLTKENAAFLGWSVDPQATQPDESFAIPQQGGDVTLYAVWKETQQPDPDPDPEPETEVTNFYISMDGTVWDYVDDAGNKVVSGRDTSYFSGSVYTGQASGLDHTYSLVGKANEAASTDAAIRGLVPDALKAVPADESVFEALRQDQKMKDYCQENGVDVSSITGENYNVYWYVVKYQDDGWHVDGVLVPKGEEPSYPVEYTVIHQYYTDNVKTDEKQEQLSGTVGGQISAADLTKQLTDTQGNTYTYTSASPESLTLSTDAAANQITLRYDRTTDTGDGDGDSTGTSTYYNLVVRYLEEGTDEELAQAYSVSRIAGSAYDVTAQTQKTIDGYTVSQITGDEVTGYMNGDREIIVYYAADLGDGEDVPLTPDPGIGGDGTGSDVDLGDGEVPLNPNPGTEGDTTDLTDGQVPLVPATGDNLALWVMAAGLSAAGLVALTLTGKKRKQENG